MNQFKKLLTSQLHSHRQDLMAWYQKLCQDAPPPFYTSMDLRDSGYKIAPVDSNLFPAGFNNLCPEDQRTSPQVMREQIARVGARIGKAQISRIAILPETNTRNTFYLDNLFSLQGLITRAGYDCKIAWYGTPPEGPLDFTTASGETVKVEPFTSLSPTAKIGEWEADLVLVNNDFSSGYPKDLDVCQTPFVPSYRLGWHTRKKSTHFVHYNELARQFAGIIQIDPWLIQVDTQEVNHVDFNADAGTDKVAEESQKMLDRIRKSYQDHGIRRKPFVFIKNNAGTYGMGIMMIHDAEEIRTMNRRTKNKMSVGKNRSEIHSVIVQEGIPTATIVDKLAAEPVIYLCGNELIGGFLRSNTERGEEENLNSQGMVFRRLCMSDLRASENGEDQECPILEMVYGSIARISAFAAGLELKASSHPR